MAIIAAKARNDRPRMKYYGWLQQPCDPILLVKLGDYPLYYPGIRIAVCPTQITRIRNSLLPLVEAACLHEPSLVRVRTQFIMVCRGWDITTFTHRLFVVEATHVCPWKGATARTWEGLNSSTWFRREAIREKGSQFAQHRMLSYKSNKV